MDGKGDSGWSGTSLSPEVFIEQVFNQMHVHLARILYEEF